MWGGNHGQFPWSFDHLEQHANRVWFGFELFNTVSCCFQTSMYYLQGLLDVGRRIMEANRWVPSVWHQLTPTWLSCLYFRLPQGFPSRELTYPSLGKGKIIGSNSSNVPPGMGYINSQQCKCTWWQLVHLLIRVVSHKCLGQKRKKSWMPWRLEAQKVHWKIHWLIAMHSCEDVGFIVFWWVSLVENGVICFCVLKCCLVFPLGYLTSPSFNKIDVNTPQLWMSLRPEKQMPDGLCLVGHETGITQERVRRHSSFGRNASEGDMARTGCGYKSTKERVPI